MPAEPDRRALAWLAGTLVIASTLVLWPFAPWLLFAAWTAIFARRLQRPLARWFGGRPRVAAAVTVVLLTLVLVPAFLLIASLVVDAVDLVRRLLATDRAQEVVRQLVSPSAPAAGDSDVVGLVMNQGGRAWGLAQQIAGTAARITIGLVVLIAGIYAMLVDGERWYRWIEDHAPVSRTTLRRFAGAFIETGHGLFVGILGAGFAQSVVATILYLVLGVPQPFALGVLTLGCSVLPAVGTAIVWIPVAIGLALNGQTTAAIVLGIGGIAVISTLDNFLRPWLTRRGELQLPTYVVLVAMFGGVELLGARGLVIAPLVIRLAKEALVLRREAREAREPG